MNFNSINWFAVVACVIYSVVLGSVWFGPKTFFPVWWKAIGKSDNDVPTATPLTWILLLGCSIVQAIFMAMMVTALGTVMGGVTLVTGALTGLMVWLGFVAPSSLTNKLFAGQYKAWAIETSNLLLTYVGFGIILGLWR